jgi:hypothetical protein
VADNSKTGKNKDVDLGVAKESEKVLVKHRISAHSRVKERCLEVTIHK